MGMLWNKNRLIFHSKNVASSGIEFRFRIVQKLILKVNIVHSIQERTVNPGLNVTYGWLSKTVGK
jgi:hypothetical protein